MTDFALRSLVRPIVALLLLAEVVAPSALAFPSQASPELDLEFDGGTRGWQTVLDGVMGGLSTGRIAAGEGGTLRFTGELSLENDGGFSQVRTSVPEGLFTGRTGLVLRVKGDGRTYQCDLRSSRARLMAGGYQTLFATEPGAWIEVEIPFEDCVLNNFGRRVRNAPPLDPSTIESIGITLSDRNPGPFALEIDWIRPLDSASGGKVPTTDGRSTAGSLATVAADANLTTLLALIGAAGLELPKDMRCTVFAPTDEAFARLPKEKVEFLTSPEGRSTLQAILKHHVVAGALGSAAVLDRRRLEALSGQRLEVDPAALTVDGARLVATDVAFDGGVVHVIDAVMLPELRTIEEIVMTDARLETLRSAIGAAGLGERLGKANPGPWTLLAPSNGAFAAVPAGALAALLADRPALTAVLAAHVLPTAIRREGMLAATSAATLAGNAPVAFALEAGAITVDGARIEVADIDASNGVIHVIDRVLLPKAPSARDAAVTMSPGRRATAILGLAIERGVPRFNAGDAASCAAIYELAVLSVVLLGEDAVAPAVKADLAEALERGAATRDDSERAWILRRAMDRALAAGDDH